MPDGRPSELGFFEIADDSGNVVSGVNRLRLGPSLSLTRNPFDPSAVIDAVGSLLGSVVGVDAVTNLRNDIFILGPSVDKIYVTKNYYTPSDAGGMSYRWNATDTTTDDGVLHIKNSHYSTGRFQPIMPVDGLMNAQACGPALTDIGSITRSFDPTGSRAIGTELYRISTILRNSGWNGLVFGRDKNGSGGYHVSGSEQIGQSTSPWVGFELIGINGVELIGNASVGCSPIGVYTVGESQVIDTGYATRTWTQTINGGERSFAGVSDITGLSVGDTVLCRFGAEDTDFSGVWKTFQFSVIQSITPSTGTTGTVVTWQSSPEKLPTAPSNPSRIPTKHDMIKITGFQDNTKITGFIITNVFFAYAFYRNFKVDCTWKSTVSFCLNGLGGIGLDATLWIGQATGTASVPGAIITLASQYDTLIRRIVVNDIVPQASSQFNIITEESSCRGTRIDFADICANTATASGNLVQFCSQTVGQNNLISVGHLVIRGLAGILIANGAYIDVLDNKSGPDTQNSVFRGDQIGSLLYHGVAYRFFVRDEYIIPIATSSVTRDVTLPNHGITRTLQIKASSITGISNCYISGDNFSTNTDITSLLSAGNWIDIPSGSFLSIGTPNFAGYNALGIRIVTSGSTPAGNALFVRHNVFLPGLGNSATAVTDTSDSPKLVGNGTPSVNSSYIGQEYFDSANSVWYRSASTGSGLQDWKASGSIQNTQLKRGTNIPNADTAITVGGGCFYVVQAGTFSAIRGITLANTSAADKQVIEVRVESQSFNCVFFDTSPTSLLTVASGKQVLARFIWDTGTGKFKLLEWFEFA